MYGRHATLKNHRLDDWITFFHKRLKPYIPLLISEMRRYNLTVEQGTEIFKGVFNRVLEDVNKQLA